MTAKAKAPRYRGTPVPAEKPYTGKKRGRPGKTPAEKILESLRADLDRNRIEYLKISDYSDDAWSEIKASYQSAISRLEAAIGNVEKSGLPDGYGEQ